MIFNRKSQFYSLDKLYKSDDNNAVILYSTIDSDLHDFLKEFLKDKDFFYYKAALVSKDEQKRLFVDSINEQLSSAVISKPDYEECLNAMLSEKCEKRVIVIDEFQLIIKYSDELINNILKCINNKWGNQPVLFLLVSSNAYFVEKQMVEKINESAYELSGLIKLPDLSFVDVMQRFSKYSKSDQIITYGITGGKSRRILSFDPAKTLKENIISSVLTEDGYLYNRGLNLLPPELREHSVYNTILFNMASGNAKLNELHKLTGFSRAKISVYINNLIEHGLIEKIVSYDTYGRDNALKGIYRIKDSFMAFFYRFVYQNLTQLEILQGEKFYEKYIEPYLFDFGKNAFRDVCFEYIMILDRIGKLPIKVSEYGTWVGKVGNIDIILKDSADHTLIGYCEFEKNEMSFEDFEWLKFCVSQAKLTGDIYYLFAKSGFDERIKAHALEAKNVVLIDTSML